MTTHHAPATLSSGGDRLHPLLGHPEYWRQTAEKFRAEGYPRLAESYELLAQRAERLCRDLYAEQAAERAS